ncbi:MAG: ribbon-helix-helix protein, CopG family [Tolypothrix carrinoi HA7290-LM1]|nr:ribbon-helix-helix protein, CopG family [Tolypothrix carrinoi HA7290-LM1]
MLDARAKSLGISRSELIEQIARNLLYLQLRNVR